MAEAESLAEDLRACAIPVLAVLGNHDHHCGATGEVEAVLRQAGVIFLEDEVHEVDGVGFAGVKGFCGGFDGRMLDAFGEAPIKAFVQEVLDQALRLEHALKELEAPSVPSSSCTTRRSPPRWWASRKRSSRSWAAPGWPKPSTDSTRCAPWSTGMPITGPMPARPWRGIPVFNVAAPVAKPDGKPMA